MRRADVAAVAACGLVIGAGAVWACGPHFPNRILDEGDADVLSLPTARFGAALAGVLPSPSAPHVERPRARAPSSEQAEIRDIRRALAAQRTSRERAEEIVRGVRALRRAAVDPSYRAELLGRDAATQSSVADVPVPDGLPAQFDGYLRGFRAYHAGDLAAARAAWRGVVDLPKAERADRSVWAAYMTGRSLVNSAPQEAVAWFRRTRDLAEEGLPDPLQLAYASWGWEARAEMNRGDLGRAADLYLAIRDEESLLHVARAVARRGDAAVRATAEHPRLCGVMAAWFAAGGTTGRAVFLQAVEESHVADLPQADLLAAIAYGDGDTDTARRWLRRVRRESWVSEWIGAKLDLRDGNLDAAADRLRRASRLLPEADVLGPERGGGGYGDESGVAARRRVLAELGAVELSRRKFVEALDLLVDARHWLDAAYVAERVLTADELKDYVDRRHPRVDGTAWCELDSGSPDPVAPEQVRYLLGRRLLREGRPGEARVYLPDALRQRADAYVQALERGRDTNSEPAFRSAALVEAARIARHEGLELMGTEEAPDYLPIVNYLVDWSAGTVRRATPGPTLVPASAEERSRAEGHRLAWEKRFHYRYLAAALAWEAAALMPDGADATAEWLCEAGGWLQARDPKAADRFYKALVRRCGGTALGREAAELRWFPKRTHPK